MPIALPETPRFAHPSERKVWHALAEQLGPNDLIVVGQRFTDHKKDYEIDFIVAMEGAGIICVEVRVAAFDTTTPPGGKGRRATPIGKHPSSRPATVVMPCVRMSRAIRCGQRWLRWDHTIALPDALIPDGLALPDCPRWKVTGRKELPDLGVRRRAVLSNERRRIRCSSRRASTSVVSR
jgi:hypothetical protein